MEDSGISLQRLNKFREVPKAFLMHHMPGGTALRFKDDIGYLINIFTGNNVIGNHARFFLLQENIAEQIHTFCSMVRTAFKTLRFDGFISVLLAPYGDQIVRLVTQEYISQENAFLFIVTIGYFTHVM